MNGIAGDVCLEFSYKDYNGQDAGQQSGGGSQSSADMSVSLEGPGVSDGPGTDSGSNDAAGGSPVITAG